MIPARKPSLGIQDNGVALLKCGSFSWETQWGVRPSSDNVNGGQILQDVEIWESINKCGESESPMILKTSLSEVWRVLPGTEIINGLYRHEKDAWFLDLNGGKKYLGWLDYFDAPGGGKCTHGRIRMTGKARYFQNKPEVDWPTGLAQGLTSGQLPTVNNNPGWINFGASDEKTHSITVKWNCCPNEEDMRDTEIVNREIK